MSNQILMSIHPEHIEKILNGEKKFEFRKIKPKEKIDKIFLYSTVPHGKVVGFADIEEIISGSPSEVWELTKNYAGINIEFYSKYYENKKTAIAFKIHNVVKFKKELNLKELEIEVAPQSFVYLNKNISERIIKEFLQ